MKVEIELDEINELKDQIEHLERQLASQTYAGNSIEYIHSKMVNYGEQLGRLGPFVKKCVEDGRLTIAPGEDDIARMIGVESLQASTE